MDHDSLRAMFRASAKDRQVIRGQGEWAAFLRNAQDAACLSPEEVPQLEGAWSAAVTEATWHLGRPEDPCLDFNRLEEHIAENFGEGFKANDAMDVRLKNASEDLATLVARIRRWDIPSFDERHTREFLAMLATLQSSLQHQQTAITSMRRRGSAAMHLTRLKAVALGGNAALTHSEPCKSPVAWQKENRRVVEAAALRRKVRLLRPLPHGRRGVGSDRFQLAYDQGFQHCMAHQGSKAHPNDVEVFAVEVARDTYSSSLSAGALRCFAAHRELSCSPFVPHTLGMDDSPPTKTRFFYEFVDGHCLRDVLDARQPCIPEDSPLFQHWVSGVARALWDLHRMSCYSSFTLASPPTLANVFVASKGVELLLGAVPWGGRLDDDQDQLQWLLEDRGLGLLAGFAGIVEDLLATAFSASTAGSANSTTSVDHGPPRHFTEEDSLFGLIVHPGEHFFLDLEPRSGYGPLRLAGITILSAHPSTGEAGPVSLTSGSLHSPSRSSTTANSFAFLALHPGRVTLSFTSAKTPAAPRRGGQRAGMGGGLVPPHSPASCQLDIHVVCRGADPSPALDGLLRCCHAARTGAAAHVPFTLDTLVGHPYLARQRGGGQEDEEVITREFAAIVPPRRRGSAQSNEA